MMSDETGPEIRPDEMMLPEQRQELERGLRFAHIMLHVGQVQGTEALASITALTGLLIDKGVLSEEEIGPATLQARDAINDLPRPRVRLAEIGDKYADEASVEIDCENRIHLCHARCCSFPFFLTAQDLEEGVAKWDYGNPYFIKRGADGYCTHCHPESRACTIHAQRPHVCRLYDCRNDKRIWIDFEKRIPAPMDKPSPALPIAMAERAGGPNSDVTPAPEPSTSISS